MCGQRLAAHKSLEGLTRRRRRALSATGDRVVKGFAGDFSCNKAASKCKIAISDILTIWMIYGLLQRIRGSGRSQNRSEARSHEAMLEKEGFWKASVRSSVVETRVSPGIVFGGVKRGARHGWHFFTWTLTREKRGRRRIVC